MYSTVAPAKQCGGHGLTNAARKLGRRLARLRCSSLLTVLLEPRIPRETMSIADADAKAAMPAGDTAPEVGSKLKANMSQPIRKGVAKWTDTVRKMAVRSPREPAPCAQTPRRRVAAPCAGPRRCAAPRFGQLGADVAVGERVGG
jgi:hypothetical protein